jgi:hypothetical protein
MLGLFSGLPGPENERDEQIPDPSRCMAFRHGGLVVGTRVLLPSEVEAWWVAQIRDSLRAIDKASCLEGSAHPDIGPRFFEVFHVKQAPGGSASQDG